MHFSVETVETMALNCHLVAQPHTQENLVIYHPRNFGNHVTLRPSAPQGHQCEMSNFLASVEARNLWSYYDLLSVFNVVIDIYSQLTAVKRGYPLTRVT